MQLALSGATPALTAPLKSANRDPPKKANYATDALAAQPACLASAALEAANAGQAPSWRFWQLGIGASQWEVRAGKQPVLACLPV